MTSADVVKYCQIAENVFGTFTALATRPNIIKMIFSSRRKAQIVNKRLLI